MSTQCHCTKCNPIISVRINRQIRDINNAINFLCTQIVYKEGDDILLEQKVDALVDKLNSLNQALVHSTRS